MNCRDYANILQPTTLCGSWQTIILQATFFEALNEYGKNFDGIQSHFQSKAARNKRHLKDKDKDKEQIREE